MSANAGFLIANWTKIKLAVQYVIRQDRNNDGMEDTPIENTLDAVWDGEISWLVGLCIIQGEPEIYVEYDDEVEE
jgi:hypothetical protein